MGAIPAEVARAGYDVERMRLVERREYLIECNWKVYVDNYLEGYHLPIAHPGLFRELDYDAYRVETFRYYSKQYAPIRELKEGQEIGRDRRYVRTAEGEGEALYYWLFPNTMFNIYQDNMSSNVILPIGVDRTLTIFEWYFAEPGTGPGWESMQQTIAFSDQIQQEDIVLCEQVQRGLRSRAYDTGRFSAQARERRLPLPGARPRVPRRALTAARDGPAARASTPADARSAPRPRPTRSSNSAAPVSHRPGASVGRPSPLKRLISNTRHMKAAIASRASAT